MPRRTPEKTHVQLQKLDVSRARLWSRLVRTVNALDKVERQRKRLLKPQPLDRLDPPVPAAEPPKPPRPFSDPMAYHEPLPPLLPVKPDDPLDIPTFMRRNLAAQNAADEAAKAAILKFEEDKKKARTKMTADRRKARLKGELRKMPAQGKEALAIIRDES